MNEVVCLYKMLALECGITKPLKSVDSKIVLCDALLSDVLVVIGV